MIKNTYTPSNIQKHYLEYTTSGCIRNTFQDFQL